MYLQITRFEITQSSCKRDTKSKSHVGMKLAPVRVFSCKHPLTSIVFVRENELLQRGWGSFSHLWKFRRGGGGVISILQKWKIQGGGGVLREIPHSGSLDIFWNYTMPGNAFSSVRFSKLFPRNDGLSGPTTIYFLENSGYF